MSKENKTKFIRKQGNVQFVMKSLKGQQLNDREVYAINNREIEGLASVDVVRKGSSFELIYNLSGLVSLRDFLVNSLNRETFGHLLQNILDVLKRMQEAFFNQQMLLMDFDKVMVNPATQRLVFIYIPIRDYNSGCVLKKFLLDIIQAGTFAKEDDFSYVKEYIRILNDGINFSVFELEEYIKGLTEEGYHTQKAVVCHKCGAQLKPGTNFCSVCGAKLSGNTGELGQKNTYDPLQSNGQPCVVKSETQSFSDVTERAESDFGGTTVLGLAPNGMRTPAYLVRVNGNEKIEITKSGFILGKSQKSCDYAVTDNRVVSRQHAQIIESDGHYYVEDLNSTNKTYVEQKAISQRVELHSGNSIKLGNEEFIFYEN